LGFKYYHMPHAVFFLKSPANPKTGCALILMRFAYEGRKLIYSFNESVLLKNWDKKNGRVKNVNATVENGSELLNEFLKNLSNECEKAYNKLRAPGPVPPVEDIRKWLDAWRKKRNGQEDEDVPEVKTLYGLIEEFEKGEVKNRGRNKSKGSLVNYTSVKLHLKAFEKAKKYKIDFDTINLEFFNKYVDFLQKMPWDLINSRVKNKKVGLSPNTISKDITILKVFMAEGFDRGYHNNQTFRQKKFSVQEEEVEAI